MTGHALTGTAVRPGVVRPLTQVSQFFLITYAVTWTCFVAAGLLHGAASSLRLPLLIVGSFAPSVVATLLTARQEGRPGVRRLHPIAAWCWAARASPCCAARQAEWYSTMMSSLREVPAPVRARATCASATAQFSATTAAPAQIVRADTTMLTTHRSSSSVPSMPRRSSVSASARFSSASSIP